MSVGKHFVSQFALGLPLMASLRMLRGHFLSLGSRADCSRSRRPGGKGANFCCKNHLTSRLAKSKDFHLPNYAEKCCVQYFSYVGAWLKPLRGTNLHISLVKSKRSLITQTLLAKRLQFVSPGICKLTNDE